MQKQILKNILIYLGGGLLCVGLLFWSLESFNGSQGHWEAEIGQAESQLALTLRLAGREDRPLNRQVVITDKGSGTHSGGTFSLPDQAEQMPGNRLKFQDTTILPGRVKFEWEGHEFDLMPDRLSVDGKKYNWKDQTPIALVR
ncbi:hypothetical protein [Gimesia sp.]|uniref:hypothetical protein n=1 Tax=Gimesia sp. TaxID=2024833 RepID=UPI003A8F3426